MIIDTHTHIYNEKTYREYLAKTEKVEKIITLAWYEDNLEEVLSFADKKDNLYLVGMVDMEKDINSQLVKLRKLFQENKIIGLKLYPGYQYFYPSDKKVYPVAELCQEFNKPLIFHSGDVWDEKGKALLKYSRPIYIDELAVNYPDCKIILSHFGFPLFMEAANVIDKNDNVFTDISGTVDEAGYCQEERKNLLDQYVKDLLRVFAYFPGIKKKVMFGTDYSGEDTPLRRLKPYISLTNQIFSEKEKENVFHKLAQNLFFS
jgi:uncharacterized protein